MTYDPGRDYCGNDWFDWFDGWPTWLGGTGTEWRFDCYLHDIGVVSDWGMAWLIIEKGHVIEGVVMGVGLTLAYWLGLRKGSKPR